ncbi:hypothetical protein [uncultured Kordia sp.]|uniref:hypothetical protein n=1 Tax=uncultured Kordia sp. TaxID=507699 RepID=UPI0026117D8E|nr:hypothetical protein [uncultured Kordia sp.]
MKKLHLKKLALNLTTISQFESAKVNGGHPTEEPTEGAQCASDPCGPRNSKNRCYQK